MCLDGVDLRRRLCGPQKQQNRGVVCWIHTVKGLFTAAVARHRRCVDSQIRRGMEQNRNTNVLTQRPSQYEEKKIYALYECLFVGSISQAWFASPALV